MIRAKALAVHKANSHLEPYSLERRSPNPDDIVIEIAYCGICHSDVHTVQGEWPATYPCVPGHEIVGRVVAVGKKVKKFKVGSLAGVGCMVDSCGACPTCKAHEEQYCLGRTVFTYNSVELDGQTPTFGGYSSHITVREKFALKINKKFAKALPRVAPLLCAGITTYSPLKRLKTKKGTKVGVIGLGGLGHMAIKFAVAMGGEVTVFSTSPDKEKSAKALGAKHFVVSTNPNNFKPFTAQLNLIIDTLSIEHDFAPFLNTLAIGGTHVLLGASGVPNKLPAKAIIFGRRHLAGSLIGGIKETQEMLDFCARKNILADIELISARQVDEAYEKTLKSQVRYRFVIDMKTL